LAVNFGPTFY